MANFARGLEAGLPLGLAFGEAARERRERKAYQEAAQQWTPEETELNLGDAPISGGASPMARGIGPQVSQEQRQQLESQRLSAPPGAPTRSQTQRRFTLPGAPGETYETEAEARKAARLPGMEAQLEAARNVGDAELVGDLTRQLSATEASDATRRLNDLRFDLAQRDDQRSEELRALSQEMFALETPEEQFEFAQASGNAELIAAQAQNAVNVNQAIEAQQATEALRAASITNRAARTYFETGDITQFYDDLTQGSNGAATLVEGEDRFGRAVYSLQITPDDADTEPTVLPFQARTPEALAQQIASAYSDPDNWLKLERDVASGAAAKQTPSQLDTVALNAATNTRSSLVQRLGGEDVAGMDDSLRDRWQSQNIDEGAARLTADEVTKRLNAQGEVASTALVESIMTDQLRYDPEKGFHIPGAYIGGEDIPANYLVEGSDAAEALIAEFEAQEAQAAEEAAELARRQAGGPGVDTPAQGLRPRDPNAPVVDLPGWWEDFKDRPLPGREAAEPPEGENTGWTGEGGVRGSPAGRFVRGLFNQGGEEPSGEQNAPDAEPGLLERTLDNVRGLGQSARDVALPPSAMPATPLETREDVVDAVVSDFDITEGVGTTFEEDPSTGRSGLTPLALQDLGFAEGTDPASLSEEEAAEASRAYADLTYDRLSSAVEGFEGLPGSVQAALLDASYNLGASAVSGFPTLNQRLAEEDYLGAIRDGLFDTATDSYRGANRTVRGHAVRRAASYNRAAAELGGTPIAYVEQDRDGTIRYVGDDDEVVFEFNTEAGRHPSSRPGRSPVRQVEQEQNLRDGGPVRRSGPGVDTPGGPPKRDEASRRDWKDSAAAGLRASRTAQSAQRGGATADVPLAYRPLEETSAMDRLRRSQVQAPRNMANGGLARKDMRGGGDVDGPGTETSDSIPARLSDGEYVLNAETVKMVGEDFLDRINKEGLRRRDSRKRK